MFKILKVFLQVKATSVEQTLGSLSSTGGPIELRHIIFIIIESGMALFAIQLVRVVITILLELHKAVGGPSPSLVLVLVIASNVVITIHQALNVSERSVSFLLLLFLLMTFNLPTRALHQL